MLIAAVGVGLNEIGTFSVCTKELTPSRGGPYIDQPFSAEINKDVKHTPDPRDEVTNRSEKLH